MKKTLLSLCGLVLVASLCGQTQPPPAPKSPQPNPSGNRFLFVIDTSSGMRRFDYANRQALFDLIYTGVNHQMQPQDTFGIWTFNNKVYAGEYPMQVWDPRSIMEVATHATRYLKSKKYTGKCEMDLVIFNLASLLHNVKDLNVLMFSDGATPMHGTPFDDAINLAYKQKAPEQRKVAKPFITTLVVRDGAIISASVTLPGEEIVVPPAPAIAQAPASPTPTAKPAPKPIIMKSAAASKAASAASPQPGTAPTTARIESASASNASNAAPAPTPAPLPADMGLGTLSESDSPESKGDTLTKGNTSALAPVAQASTANPKEESINKIALKDPTPTIPKATPEKTSLTPGAPSETAIPEPAKSALHEAASNPPPHPNNSANRLDKPLGGTPAEPAQAPAATQALAVVTPKPIFNPQILILAGGILLGAALCLLVMVFRRLHKSPQPSIITRSLEHHS